MMRALFLFEKYKSNIYDVGRMGRYTRNIFQGNKNDIKSRIMTNGDYYEKLTNVNVIPIRVYKTRIKVLKVYFAFIIV